MPEFDKLYLELYHAINDALAYMIKGEHKEAVICLLDGQVNTVKQIFSVSESS